ncbi:MAG: RNB domain-containing ribonuclease, partial [Gemmatimonadaceae bacterium]
MTDLDLVSRQALVDNGFTPDESADVRTELATLRAPAAEPGLRDMRALVWSSIDNPTSKDLDQIEVAEASADGSIVLRIGIADVDALVPKGSAIDRHA